MHLRPAQPGDRDAIMALIDSVLREYGDQLFIEGADADLLDIDAHYKHQGGHFVVLDDGGRIRGTHALRPLQGRPGICNVYRLYLDPDLRGGEWGEHLMQWAIDTAREHGFHRIEFWSDTRFTRAHAFFKRLGFRRDGRTRDMDDGAFPYREYFYFMDAPFPDFSQCP